MRPVTTGFLVLLALCCCACGPLPEPVARASSQAAQPSLQVEAYEPTAARPEALSPARAVGRKDWSPLLNSIVGEYVLRGVRHSAGKARAADFDVSLHVMELDSGQEWGSRRADHPQLPASNMKLVTTAAALVLLGPGQDFVTPVEAVGKIEAGRLRGDLVLRAAGDPIVDPSGSAAVEQRLDAIAQELRRLGVQRISGDVLLDESDFAEPAPAPGWPASNQHWQEHCALSAGFSINGGVLEARVTPSSSGGAARIEVHPAPHGLRSNYGVSSTGQRLNVQVGATISAVTVKGEIPPSHQPFLGDFSHPDPVELFGRVLMARLEAGGVSVEGQLRRQRGVPAGRQLLALRSSLDDVLIPINRYSRNSVADQLLLALGHALGGAGTFEAGARVTARALSELGVPSAGFHQADGSGLSRDNRVSARQLSALIRGVMVRDPQTRRVFQESLAQNGKPGSLEDRMLAEDMQGRVFAKTGWITGASALAGICQTLDGRWLAFSILIAYPPELGGLNTNCFKPMQDALVTALVTGKS